MHMDSLAISNNIHICLIVVDFVWHPAGSIWFSVLGIETSVSCFLDKHSTTGP